MKLAESFHLLWRIRPELCAARECNRLADIFGADDDSRRIRALRKHRRMHSAPPALMSPKIDLFEEFKNA